jgi:hypothetical protein
VNVADAWNLRQDYVTVLMHPEHEPVMSSRALAEPEFEAWAIVEVGSFALFRLLC